MKNIKTFEMFFSKEKEGDKLAEKIINIIQEENIKFKHDGGFTVDIDDKIYSFSKYGFNDCYLNIYDNSQRLSSGIITGKSKSKYKISNKFFKKLEMIYNNTQKSIKSDLEDLNDTNRDSKKYNL